MSGSLLGDLMSGTEDTRSILLQDSSQWSGRLLLKTIALQSLRRYSFLHLFLFDVHPEFWLCGVAPDSRKSFLQAIGQATPSQELDGSDCAVVIDSLSTLLDFHSTPRVCQLVHQLERRCGLVVGLVHSDLHDCHVTSQLSHVMSTTIEINRVPSPNAGHHFQAKELHRKTSGKLLVKTELVTISNDYEVTSLPLSMCTNQQSAPEVTPDPTANLTFDLTLSEREKEERGRLVLPYHHSHQKKTALLQAGSGQIHYQPDEGDDYDDSDPDDDLDI